MALNVMNSAMMALELMNTGMITLNLMDTVIIALNLMYSSFAGPSKAVSCVGLMCNIVDRIGKRTSCRNFRTKSFEYKKVVHKILMPVNR